jgi:hypothetical protein
VKAWRGRIHPLRKKSLSSGESVFLLAGVHTRTLLCFVFVHP